MQRSSSFKGAKLALNIYRGWVGERAKRDLRRPVHTIVEAPAAISPAAEAQGIVISMIVAEVEPIGGFAGESVLSRCCKLASWPQWSLI